MRRKLMLAFFMFGALTIALMAADEKATADATTIFLWTTIVGGAALTIAAVAGAFNQSRAFSIAAQNIARNPAAADTIRTALIITLALIESLVIYVLLVDIILFFMKWGDYTIG
jgi:F-type H+-transporting ATPase subunit c